MEHVPIALVHCSIFASCLQVPFYLAPFGRQIVPMATHPLFPQPRLAAFHLASNIFIEASTVFLVSPDSLTLVTIVVASSLDCSCLIPFLLVCLLIV